MTIPKIALVVQVLILALPIYIFRKWLQKKLNPRHSFKQFFIWFLIIIIASAIWYALGMFVYYKLYL